MTEQVLINGLIRGFLYALSAVGFGLIYNTTRVLHVVHGAIFGAGGYFLFLALDTFGLPWWLGLAVAVALSAILGCASDLLVYRPLQRRGASSDIAFVSSLGAYIVLVNAFALIWGSESKILKSPLEATVSVGQIVLSWVQVAEGLAFLAILGGLIVCLRRTRAGRLLRAARDNTQLLAVLGFDTNRVRWLAFASGSALAGLAGALLALDVGVEPYAGFAVILTAAVAVIIGGIGVFEGGILGGIIIGLAQSIAAWKLSSGWEEPTTFVLLLLVLLLRPQGLMGSRLRLEEV